MKSYRGKKVVSKVLAFLTAIALVVTNVNLAFAAEFVPSEGTFVISDTKQKIAPGITESKVIVNNSLGNNQNIGYFCEVDLANTATTKIISGYADYDASNWKMQKLSDQAKAAEKATGCNVVAGINADFYNMATGEPSGALVMNGKVYHKANYRPYFAILKDGTAVIREGNVSLDDVQEAVGGDTIIARDGKVCNYDENSSYQSIVYSRCAIGIKEDGSVVTYTTHGRNYPISCGQNYKEVAEMLIGMGCKTVLNLDGGGSATYSSKHEGSNEFLCRNNPSDGTERLVSSTLLIVSEAKATGEFDHAALTPNDVVYTPNSKVQFEATGVDSAGGKAELPSDIQWALEDSKYGEIDENGIFTSNGTVGEVKVNLLSNGEVVGTTAIIIDIPDSITFSNDEVSLGFAKESTLGITVKAKGRDVIYKDGDFKWTLTDEKMGTFNGNVFTSSDSETINGDVTATCVYDESVSGSVHLIIGRLPSVALDFEDKVNEETGETIPAEDYYSITTDKEDTSKFLLLAGYGRGAKQGAEIVNLDSEEPVRFGSHSLRLDYDFTADITSTDGACIGYTEGTKPVEGNPTGIGMWVYAPEGTANLWLRIYLNDGNGSLVALNFTEEAKISQGKMGGIDWTGWKYVEASLEGRTGPFTLVKGQTVRLMYVPGIKMGYYKKGATNPDGTYEMVEVPQAQRKGSIYIDNLQFVYGANKDDIDNPIVDSITANGTEITDGMTIDTNTIEFKSLYSDVENKNTSGVDYDTVRVYVDGVNMSSEANCVNVPGDNAINLYDVNLSNGAHNIKVSLRDKFGNETVETRTFVVSGEKEYSKVAIAPKEGELPILNKTFDLELTADDIENIDAVETQVKINKDFSDYEVVFNDDFEGSATYDAKNTVVKLDATRKAGISTQTGKQVIATLKFKVPKELKKGSVFTYFVQKGLITYNNEQEEGYTKTFATLQEGIEVVAPLTVKADQMVVGFNGKVYVNDLDNNPVSEATIYKDGVDIGQTNEEGYLETDALCQEAGKYSIYTQKGEDISYAINITSSTVAGNEEGLPEYVISNATTGSATTKNITWMSNPKTSANKAIIKIAKKADYEANGEAAFTEVAGTSKLQSFLGSSDSSQNRTVRVNKVLATGLTKNTKYVYCVGDGVNWSEIKEFKTNRSGVNTNFFVIGDTQISNKENVDTIASNLAKDGNYSFGIQTGDSVDNASIYSHWTDVLQLFGDNYLSQVDMVHVLGNHEFMGDLDGDAAQNIYNLPDVNRYSVEYGNVYVATISYTTDKNQLKADLEWLKQDAKASKCKWKVLTTHQPAYYTNPSGSNEMMNELVPDAAEEAGIDFVFSGHDHTYARTKPMKDGQVDKDNGIVYYICGSTGEKSYSVVENADFNFDIATQNFNGIYITASTTDDEFTVITHDVDGSIIDTYTKSKTSESCVNGHEYSYDGEYLTCKHCGYSKPLGNYTGFVTEEKSGKTMYFINGEFQTGWTAYGADELYHFGEDGLAHDVVVLEDIPTTCTTRGHKTYKCNDCELTYTTNYVKPGGHVYVKHTEGEHEGKYICSNCGQEGIDIASLDIKLGFTKTTYSGSKKCPAVIIDNVVKEGNYALYYFDNIKAGTARVVIRTKGGDYAGEVTKTFTIRQKDILDEDVQIEYDSIEYDGTEKTPSVTVKSTLKAGEVTLKEGTDYTVEYQNNLKPGAASVVVTGIGNFKGTITKTFAINAREITCDNVEGFNSPSNTTTEIDLAWDKGDCDGYEIYKYSLTTKKFELLKDITDSEVTSFTDGGKTPGSYSRYKVRAYKINDADLKVYSEFSDELKVTTNPLAPVINAEAKEEGIELTWDKVKYATGYEVYRYNEESGEYDKLGDTNELIFTDKTIELCTEYKYVVKAYRTVDEENVYSEESNAVELQKRFELEEKSKTINSVEFTWDKLKDATVYKVYRYSTSTKEYEYLDTVNYVEDDAASLTFKDEGRISATMYQYRVKAYKVVEDKEVYLGRSNTFKAVTNPLKPYVTVESTTKGKASLSWTKISSRTTGYEVYMSTSKDSGYKLIDTTTDKAYTKSSLTSGKTYYFKVRAYRTVDGENIYGAYSTVKSVKVK